MLVRFWGTRGSLPTPLGHRAVRASKREHARADIGNDRALCQPCPECGDHPINPICHEVKAPS